MIKISRLEPSEMLMFKRKKVLIYSHNIVSMEIFQIFKAFNIEVLGYCVEERQSIQVKIKCAIRGLDIIDSRKLSKIIKNEKNIIIQSVAFDRDSINKIEGISEKNGIEFSKYSSGEIMNSFGYKIIFKELQNPILLYYKFIRWKRSCKETTSVKLNTFMNSTPNNPIVICSPPKTADITLNYTIDEINNNLYRQDRRGEMINYINLSHRTRILNKKRYINKLGTLKIITGIREPIAQNISRMFQDISSGRGIENWIFGEIFEDFKEINNNLRTFNVFFEENGDNIQLLWECYVKRYIYSGKSKYKLSYQPKSIQHFMSDFNEMIINIYKYPFDKEKGYTVIKEGNIEVFIYQLEKLNDIIPDLADYIGVPFEKLTNGNKAEDKWIGNNYKQALQEIKITQEYFDRCYNELYVQHCYSQEDIEKFKARWRPHIKNYKKLEREE